MAASASQLGRDIVFRLRVMADPNDFKVLTKFGDETVKVQKKIDDNWTKIRRQQFQKEERDKQAQFKMQER